MEAELSELNIYLILEDNSNRVSPQGIKANFLCTYDNLNHELDQFWKQEVFKNYQILKSKITT